jgi:hypothetical protein
MNVLLGFVVVTRCLSPEGIVDLGDGSPNLGTGLPDLCWGGTLAVDIVVCLIWQPQWHCTFEAEVGWYSAIWHWTSTVVAFYVMTSSRRQQCTVQWSWPVAQMDMS